MTGKTMFALALFLAAGVDLQGGGQAFARGGAPNLMGSPGYQRALEESRKRYRDSASQADVKPRGTSTRKKSRHRSQH